MNRRGSRHKPKHPDLFAGIGHNSARPRARESLPFYTGVLFLRIYGAVSVWRAGREHMVDGRQVSTGQLIELAQAASLRICGDDQIPGYALYRLGMAPMPVDFT